MIGHQPLIGTPGDIRTGSLDSFTDDRGCMRRSVADCPALSRAEFKTRHLRFALAMGPFLLGPALAQEQPAIELEPIIIQGQADGVVKTTAGDVKGYRALTATSATQTETPLRQIPQSIEVVPRSILDDQGITSIGEALKNVSGAVGQSAQQTPVYNSNYIRGFVAEQYFDGLAAYLYAGDPNSFADVERIEVLKGPNAILYGGGSGTPLGGVINVVSKLPTPDRFLEFGGAVGSQGYYSPYFDINQPLSSNGTVLFRATGTYTGSDSETDVVNTKRYSFNPTLTLTNNAGTTLTLQGRLSRWQQPEYQGLPAVGTVAGPFRLRRNLFIGTPDIPDSYSENKSITASLDHVFNQTWSSSTKLRYGKTSFSQRSQLILGNTPDIGQSTWNLYNSRTEEERNDVSIASHILGKFSSGLLESKFLFGVDYSRISENSATRLDGPVGAVDLLSPGSWPAYVRPSGLPAIDGDNVYRTYGAYAQLQTTVASRLHVLGGLRLARLEIDQYSPTTLRRDDTAKTKLLPRVGAVFDLTSQFSIFADYSEGMKGNPFYLFSGPALPEFSRQYEAGIKFDLDYGLSGSAAVFQIERSNVPVSDPNDPYRLTSLAAGEQRSRGFDTELTWQPDAHWKIKANYAYVDAELTKDIPGGAQAANKLAAIPRHSGGLWVDYSFGGGLLSGWSAGAGLYAASGAPLNLENTYETEAYVTVDAAIRYSKNGLSAGLTVKNITDEKYYLPYMYLIGGVYSAPSRSVLLNVAQRF